MSQHTPSQWTICTLSYGDFPQLAARLSQSLQRIDLTGCHFRIGLNNVSDATRAIWRPWRPESLVLGSPPYFKYPVMRQLFHQPPLQTPYVMWFDDDSCLAPEVPWDFLTRVANKLYGAEMVGQRMWCRLCGNQPHAIQQAPWYKGRIVAAHQPMFFCTGGWWAATIGWLQQHQWPPPELEHRGGDVLTGSLFYEQGYRMVNWHEGVWISADDEGKTNTQPRRGCDQEPWGVQ